MARKHLLILALTLTLILIGQTSFAQPKFGLGVRISYNSPATGAVDGWAPSFDGGLLYELNATYFFNDSLSLELSGGQSTVDNSKGVFTGKIGELTQTPILLTSRVHYGDGGGFSPYVGLGLGYHFQSLDGSFSSSATAEDRFGWHVAGGLEMFLSEHVSLNLDLKYTMRLTDGFATGLGYMAGIGVKYYFGQAGK